MLFPIFWFLLAANCSTVGSNWELTGEELTEGAGVIGERGTHKTGSSWVNILPGSEVVGGGQPPPNNVALCPSVRPHAGQ